MRDAETTSSQPPERETEGGTTRKASPARRQEATATAREATAGDQEEGNDSTRTPAPDAEGKQERAGTRTKADGETRNRDQREEEREDTKHLRERTPKRERDGAAAGQPERATKPGKQQRRKKPQPASGTARSSELARDIGKKARAGGLAVETPHTKSQ